MQMYKSASSAWSNLVSQLLSLSSILNTVGSLSRRNSDIMLFCCDNDETQADRNIFV